MNTSTTPSTTARPAVFRFLLTCILCCTFGLTYGQIDASEGEANHPRSYQIPKYTPPGGYGHSKRYLRKLRTNSDLFSDLIINISHNAGQKAGYLVTVTFESKLHAHLHINVINKRNRIKHTEVYAAREGKNLLLLDIEDLRQGDYRILISKGNQYMRSGFVKI